MQSIKHTIVFKTLLELIRFQCLCQFGWIDALLFTGNSQTSQKQNVVKLNVTTKHKRVLC